MIIIDGESFDVPVVSMKRRADFLDKFAERTENGVLNRELIGVYFNYQLEFGKAPTIAIYADLWEKLTEPEEFHTVTVPDVDGADFTFTAYFSNVKDEIQRVRNDGTTHFKGLTVNFTAQSPART